MAVGFVTDGLLLHLNAGYQQGKSADGKNPDYWQPTPYSSVQTPSTISPVGKIVSNTQGVVWGNDSLSFTPTTSPTYSASRLNFDNIENYSPSNIDNTSFAVLLWCSIKEALSMYSRKIFLTHKVFSISINFSDDGNAFFLVTYYYNNTYASLSTFLPLPLGDSINMYAFVFYKTTHYINIECYFNGGQNMYSLIRTGLFGSSKLPGFYFGAESSYSSTVVPYNGEVVDIKIYYGGIFTTDDVIQNYNAGYYIDPPAPPLSTTDNYLSYTMTENNASMKYSRQTNSKIYQIPTNIFVAKKLNILSASYVDDIATGADAGSMFTATTQSSVGKIDSATIAVPIQKVTVKSSVEPIYYETIVSANGGYQVNNNTVLKKITSNANAISFAATKTTVSSVKKITTKTNKAIVLNHLSSVGKIQSKTVAIPIRTAKSILGQIAGAVTTQKEKNVSVGSFVNTINAKNNVSAIQTIAPTATYARQIRTAMTAKYQSMKYLNVTSEIIGRTNQKVEVREDWLLSEIL